VIGTFGGIVLLQLLPHGVGMPSNDRVLTGIVIAPSLEDFTADQVFVDLSATAFHRFHRQTAGSAAARTIEDGAHQQFQFGIDLFRRYRGPVRILDSCGIP
jgi:hypothetical protein